MGTATAADGHRSGLRIAFFTDSFAPTHDGVARVTSTLAEELGRLGHAVTVYTVRGPGQPRVEVLESGTRVRRFTALPAPGYPQYHIALSSGSLLYSLGRQFDVAHIHTPGFVGLAGWLAARAAGIPTVGTYHTNLTDMLRGAGRTPLARAFFRAWARFSVDLCRHCDLATAPSEVALATLAEDPPFAASGRRPRLVPNGVDTDRFLPGEPLPDWRRRLGLADEPVITFVGRLTRDKGAGRFLDALALLPDEPAWTALLAGEGPERDALKTQVRTTPRLAAHVRLLGPVAEQEKPALLGQSQVFVLPSLSDTSSVALLEAMSSGVACVVTAEGGPEEIARRSGGGLRVDPRDPTAVADAVDRLLREPALARSMGERGRQWVVAHASLRRMAREFESCYRDVRS